MQIQTFKEKLNSLDAIGKTNLIINILKTQGVNSFEENVTQYEHATQSAYLAKSQGASSLMIVAALLHDVGHLFVTDYNVNDYNEEDHYHENLFVEIFKDFFPQIIIDTVKFHVLAKRYLVSTEDGYYETLSEASKNSFKKQGGCLNQEDLNQLESQTYFNEIIMLRKWDDEAKVINAKVPPIDEYYNDIVESFKQVYNEVK